MCSLKHNVRHLKKWRRRHGDENTGVKSGEKSTGGGKERAESGIPKVVETFRKRKSMHKEGPRKSLRKGLEPGVKCTGIIKRG